MDYSVKDIHHREKVEASIVLRNSKVAPRDNCKGGVGACMI